MLAIVVVSILASCSARKAEPIAAPIDREDVAFVNGRMHYMEHCQKCHPQGEGGLGQAINSNRAPMFLIRMQVRQGFGAMPTFSSDEIPDEELDDILVFLRALRRN